MVGPNEKGILNCAAKMNPCPPSTTVNAAASDFQSHDNGPLASPESIKQNTIFRRKNKIGDRIICSR